ncbi:MAG: glycosyltransferase [Bryobacteraceae bacterium]|jgi:glycosyltransferase involved in cell wall biosynthesis
MRIAQIVPSLEEKRGGPSKSVLRLAAALSRLGHEVDLLATQPGNEAAIREDGRLRVRQFRRDRPEFLCASSDLREHLRTHTYDYLHHHALWLRTLHYTCQAGRATGARWVISPRGMLSDWSWRHRRWKKWLAARLVHPGAFAQTNGWHATSAAEADDIRRRGFSQPICVAPNGVEVPVAEELTRAHEVWSQLCPAVAARPVALFYSRFHRKKRLLELIDLWIDIAPKEWLLLVAGIPQEYTVESLTNYVLRHSAQDRIVVFDGSDRPPPYGVASLFLLPSHTENFGLVVAEAMAWGVPVLVTDTTPWAEISAQNAGWCVPWKNYGAALRQAIAESTDRLEQRGARARDWVLARYSWEQAARPLAGFYERLGNMAT